MEKIDLKKEIAEYAVKTAIFMARISTPDGVRIIESVFVYGNMKYTVKTDTNDGEIIVEVKMSIDKSPKQQELLCQ